jgi:D-cysteine desulfhydrase
VTEARSSSAKEGATKREPLLFAEAPGARTLPFLPLAELPTPVEPLVLPGLRGGLFQKRDDRASALYGGNKVRRFEWVLADALDRGARTVVTAGGYASTQVSATILHARAQGLDVDAVLFEQPMTRFAREALATDASVGARLFDGRGYARTAWLVGDRMRRASRPYLLLPGASSPLPNLGYVDAALELAEQVHRGEIPRPDRILLPTGSGGTAIGLALGIALLGWPTIVTSVRIAEPLVTNRFSIGGLLYATRRRLEKLGLRGARRLRDAHVAIDGRFLGDGYGFPTAASRAALPHVRALLGVPGEVTYSAKGIAALEAWSRERPKETILYWHTLSSTGRGDAAADEAPPAALPSELRGVFARTLVA